MAVATALVARQLWRHAPGGMSRTAQCLRLPAGAWPAAGVRPLCATAQLRRDGAEPGDDGWSKPAAEQRHERILTVPNVLSLGRVLASPVVGYLIMAEQHRAALGLFVAVGVTDFLDGWIARRWNQRSVLGTALDPFADKLLMTIVTVTVGATGLLPLPLAALIIARDVALLAGGFVLRYLSLPPPRTWARYWDVKLPTAEVRPSTVSKVNTALQLVLMGATLAAPVGGFLGHPALVALQWTVAGTTVASGLGYLFKGREHIVFLNQSRNKP